MLPTHESSDDAPESTSAVVSEVWGRRAGIENPGPACREDRIHRECARRQDDLGMAAQNLTRVSLELGGNDPALVLADAELDAAAMNRLGIGAFLTTGQVCMAMNVSTCIARATTRSSTGSRRSLARRA